MGQVTEVTQIAPAISNQTALTPMAMIGQALQSGASAEMMQSLMDLQDRYEAKQACRAFDEAMAEAKAEIPVIKKNRTVTYDARSGGKATSYKHEDLAEIARTVSPILAKHGLSYRYLTTSAINEPVSVTCIITHRAGHRETCSTLCAGRDDSGGKNSIQGVASTVTYLQRMTLKASLGLAASDVDDDGHGSEGAPATITSEQIMHLKQRISETKSSEEKLLRVCKVESLADLTPAGFNIVCGMLDQKKVIAQ